MIHTFNSLSTPVIDSVIRTLTCMIFRHNNLLTMGKCRRLLQCKEKNHKYNADCKERFTTLKALGATIFRPYTRVLPIWKTLQIKVYRGFAGPSERLLKFRRCASPVLVNENHSHLGF